MPFLTPAKPLRLKFVAFGPKCKHCKFYLKDNLNPRLSECKKYQKTSEESVLYEFAEICRKKFDLCGPSGYGFELKDLIDFVE